MLKSEGSQEGAHPPPRPATAEFKGAASARNTGKKLAVLPFPSRAGWLTWERGGGEAACGHAGPGAAGAALRRQR